jgi:hypothetical protein
MSKGKIVLIFAFCAIFLGLSCPFVFADVIYIDGVAYQNPSDYGATSQRQAYCESYGDRATWVSDHQGWAIWPFDGGCPDNSWKGHICSISWWGGPYGAFYIYDYGLPRYPDSDSDGLSDNEDPFPQNDLCPGSGSWQRFATWSCEDGCEYSYYRDLNEICGQIVASTCDVPDTEQDPDTCTIVVDVYLSDRGKPYDQLGISGNISGFGDTSVVANRFETNSSLVSSEGGLSGNSSYEQINATADPAGYVMADYLAAIQANTAEQLRGVESLSGQLDAINRNLSTISGQIGQQTTTIIQGQSSDGSSSDGGSVNMTETNNLLSDIKGILTENATVAPLSDSDFDANVTVPDDMETDLGGLVDNFLNNSTVSQVLENSGIQTSDEVCSVSGEIFGAPVNLDFCGDQVRDTLDSLGNLIIAVAGLIYLFIVFK